MNKIHLTFIFLFFVIAQRTYSQAAFMDSTFGNFGFSFATFGQAMYPVRQPKIKLQPDNKILARFDVATDANGIFREHFLVRFLENGSPDTSFGVNGSIFLNPDETEYAWRSNNDFFIIRDNGHILTAYSKITNQEIKTVLLQYDSNGQPDPNFGTNGRFEIQETTPSGGIGHSPVLNEIFLLSNGQIIMVYQSGFGNYTDPGFRVINGNGTLPNNSEVYWWSTDEIDDYAYKVLLQPDNKIVLGGGIKNHDASTFSADVFVARFETDGYIDENFGTQGFARHDLSGSFDRMFDILLLSDGKILGTGILNNNELFTAKFNSDGSLDTGFGDGGKQIYPVIPAVNFEMVAISSPQNEQGFVVAADQHILRLRSNGDIDSSFNAEQAVYLPVPAGNEYTLRDIIVLPDNRILVAGNLSQSGGNQLMLARLLPGANAIPWYRDEDEDGYGDDQEILYSAELPAGYTLLPGDCDDQNPAVHPGAIDICNGIDDDCDGILDEVPTPECEASILLPLDNTGIATLTPEQILIPNPTLPCTWTIQEWIIDTSSFTCTDAGLHQITLSAISALGETGTCTTIVHVLDDTPPVSVCISELDIILDDTGLFTLLPALVDAGSTDNCGISFYTVNPMQFTSNNIGSNAVTLTVTDAAGNSSDCIINLTVSENTSSAAETNAALSAVKLMPNPAADMLIVQTDDILRSDVCVSLYDNCGVLMVEKTILAGSTLCFIDTQTFHNGIYLLRILENGGQKSKKVLIQH